MARLPQPGGDAGTWGDLLNDFLAQEHNADKTLKRGPAIDQATQDIASLKTSKADQTAADVITPTQPGGVIVGGANGSAVQLPYVGVAFATPVADTIVLGDSITYRNSPSPTSPGGGSYATLAAVAPPVSGARNSPATQPLLFSP